MKGSAVDGVSLPVLICFFEDWGGGVGIGGQVLRSNART